MGDMMDKIVAIKSIIDGDQDNLLKAMAMLASAGHITIIPKPDFLTTKPVILLPEKMYERLLNITQSGQPQERNR